MKKFTMSPEKFIQIYVAYRNGLIAGKKENKKLVAKIKKLEKEYAALEERYWNQSKEDDKPE